MRFPFIKYLLGTILAAYKDFGDRVALVDTRLCLRWKWYAVASKNQNRPVQQAGHPMNSARRISDSSIEGALRKLVAADELKKEGKGKSTCYLRLN